MARAKLTWATNVAPPYRIPMWRALGRVVDLNVWLMAENEHNRRWAPPEEDVFATEVLPTFKGRIGEDTLYICRTKLPNMGASVILPQWSSPASWQILAAAKRRGAKTLAFNESTPQSRRFSRGMAARLRSTFFGAVDGVLTVSSEATAYVESCGVQRSRIFQTTNSVDVRAFRSSASIARPVTPPHTFLFVGQLIQRKQCHIILQALRTEQLSNCHLLVAGDGPERSNLARQAEGLGIGERVSFLGYVEPHSLPSVLERAHCLVMPSSREVHGLVAAEALASGMHAIVSRAAGISTALEGMPGVWTVDPTEPDIADAMVESARQWTGTIEQPLVWEHDAEKMAADVAFAVRRIASL